MLFLIKHCSKRLTVEDFFLLILLSIEIQDKALGFFVFGFMQKDF